MRPATAIPSSPWHAMATQILHAVPKRGHLRCYESWILKPLASWQQLPASVRSSTALSMVNFSPRRRPPKALVMSHKNPSISKSYCAMTKCFLQQLSNSKTSELANSVCSPVRKISTTLRTCYAWTSRMGRSTNPWNHSPVQHAGPTYCHLPTINILWSKVHDVQKLSLATSGNLASP